MSTQLMFRGLLAAFTVAVGTVLLAGHASAANPEIANPEIEVQHPWARASLTTQPGGNTAVYMEITNSGKADELLESVVTDVADKAEIHSMMFDEGVMRMEPIAGLPIPAGQTAELQQGAFHLMLLGLHHPLQKGDKINIALHFQKSGVINVEVPVVATPINTGMHGQMNGQMNGNMTMPKDMPMPMDTHHGH